MSEIKLMNNSAKIIEKDLHQIWLTQNFSKELSTIDGELISVLNPGNYNTENSGPDFKNARIKINGLTFIGDVEIDNDYSDWKKHSHNINKNYNKVILHISLTNSLNQKYIYTTEGRKVLSIPIQSYLSEELIKTLIVNTTKKINRDEQTLKCSSEIESVEIDFREKYILKHGMNRFQNKCNKIYSRLKELKFLRELKLNEPIVRYELSQAFSEKNFSHEDFKDKYIWKQLLYELIFEALGYSQNKTIMKKLAQNVNLEIIEKLEYNSEFIMKLESLFFNVGGLIPKSESQSQTNDSEYFIKLKQTWQEINKIYDGRKFDETQWHFLGQRPQNFPTIRIAGGTKIVEAILFKNFAGVIIKKFSEIQSIKVLINSIRSLLIIKSYGYWKNHYIFEKESKAKINYFVGISRADEIFVNIILPYLSVYFDMFGNPELSKKVLKVFNYYEQLLDNKIVRIVAKDLQVKNLGKKTIYAQGMIELYRNYCTKNKCLECEIGKQIFSSNSN